MNAAAEALTAKIGPLPAWAWGLGAGVVIAAGRALINLRNEPEPVAAEPVPTDIEVGGEAFTLGTGPTAMPVYRQTGSGFSATDQPTPTSTGPATNADWAKAATRWGLANTATDPTRIADAIARYLQGAERSEVDVQFINAAIRAIGPVPEGAPTIIRQPVPVAPPPAPTPQNPPPVPVAPPPAPVPVAPPPAPVAPPPGPAPVPYPTRPFRILRFNGGPDGPGSFIAVFLGTNGVMGWIPDGNTYNGFASAFPVDTLSESAFVSAVNSTQHYGPAPRWMPAGARW